MRIVPSRSRPNRRCALRSIVSACLVAVLMCCGGCLGAAPDCNDAGVKQKIADLFRRQLKLTPYVRYIDMSRASLNLEAVFAADTSGTAAHCVAFVTYNAQLNDAGQHAENKDKILYNLLYELGGEKQVYYSVKRQADGSVAVHVDRVGG